MLGIVILQFQRNDAKPTTIKFYVNPQAQGLESQCGRDKPTLMVLQIATKRLAQRKYHRCLHKQIFHQQRKRIMTTEV